MRDLTKEQLETLSAEMEKAKKIDRILLEEIYEQRWFKLFVPEVYGGRMTPLPEALKIFEEAARMDGNLGWLITIGSGGGMFAAFMEPETSRALFSPREAVVAGSGMPTGVARKVEGGYMVSGEWKYCSGSSYATVFTANCRMADGDHVADEQAAIRAVALMPEQVEIVPDWQAFGLKATESNTIKVHDAFVPEARTFDLMELRSFHEHAIYRYPFLPFAITSFAAVVLGIARHFAEEALRVADLSKDAWESANPRRYSFVKERTGHMEKQLFDAREKFYQTVQESWDQAEKGIMLTEEEQEQVGAISRQAARTAVKCADELLPYLGMNAIMEDSPLNRIWRDLHTAAQHAALVSYEDRYC